jgi:hypothetical protein
MNMRMRIRSSFLHTAIQRRSSRQGATVVETSLVLMAFLLLLFGMLEMGLIVFQRNAVSHAARQVARRAIVRGELAPPEMASWGPVAYTSPASAAGEIAEMVKPLLVGLDLDRTSIQLEWIDGNHRVEDRVRVTVTTLHSPLLLSLFTDSWSLSGVSTMSIAH